VTPLIAAKREAGRWYTHELGLLFQRLKTLPEVRAGLVYQANMLGIEDPVQVVGAVLQWWLQRVCPKCGGVQQVAVAGTGRLSGKVCKVCRGSGEAKLPFGPSGRRLLDHINDCRTAAVKGLSSDLQSVRLKKIRLKP
jgi:hypothetical protein